MNLKEYRENRQIDRALKARDKREGKIYKQKPYPPKPSRLQRAYFPKPKRTKSKRLPALPYIDIAGEFSTRRKQ